MATEPRTLENLKEAMAEASAPPAEAPAEAEVEAPPEAEAANVYVQKIDALASTSPRSPTTCGTWSTDTPISRDGSTPTAGNCSSNGQPPSIDIAPTSIASKFAAGSSSRTSSRPRSLT